VYIVHNLLLFMDYVQCTLIWIHINNNNIFTFVYLLDDGPQGAKHVVVY
jgi:hypothetical protein